MYWEEADNQLRSVSDSFGDDFRNSHEGEEGLDSRLGGVNGHILHNTNTTFGTSEEYKTPPPGSSPPALYRNSETELTGKRNGPTPPSLPETDAQNVLHSVSETRFEVDRRDPEVSKSEGKPIGSHIADGSEDLSQLPQLIHDYLIVVKEQQQGKKLKQDLLRVNVAWKVKDLSNDQYSLETIFSYYDWLTADDSQINALISSICGGELDVRNS